MNKVWQSYRNVPRTIWYLVGTEFLLYLINAGFILILNILLRKEGYSDEQIANYTSYRFLGVLLLAFPFGVFIKGKRLKPYFFLAGLVVPLASVDILYAIHHHQTGGLVVGFTLWGIGLMLLQVCVVPFIMRTAAEDVVSESLAMSFGTWSFAMIVAGLLIAGLSQVEVLTGVRIGEQWILGFLTALSAMGLLLVWRMTEGPPRSPSPSFLANFQSFHRDYDWGKIGKAIAPIWIISIGAGLTIPFINLFFFNVFGVDSDRFSLYGSLSALLVLVGAFFVPTLRRNLGYKVSIIGTQVLAIGFLVVLALTEVFQSVPGILWLAVTCFILRQPLMNMANPLTSEMTMKYVGEKNQELISALTSSIWSAAWFVSAKIFQTLRGAELDYYNIFFITAALYALGVLWYYFLIREFEAMGAPEPLAEVEPALPVE